MHVTRALSLCLLLPLLCSCAVGYVWQAARGQWQLNRASQPIETVLARPALDEKLRAQLLEIQAARAFAVRELGLPDNAIYTRNAEVPRDFLVWNVVATAEFSLTPQHWCFPVAGCVSYRGYFRQRSAERFAAGLQKRGMDVHVGGVAAYSTLGHFKDPVPNTLLRYGNETVVSTIFHELAHQLIYLPGDSEFNESFAVTVEEAGIERWLKARGKTAALERLNRRRLFEQQYQQVFALHRKQLQQLFATRQDPVTMRRSKRAIFASLAVALADLESKAARPTTFATWLRAGLNNSHLASLATYQDCVPGLQRLLAEQGGDLPRFYAAVRRVAGLPPSERRAQLCNG